MFPVTRVQRRDNLHEMKRTSTRAPSSLPLYINLSIVLVLVLFSFRNEAALSPHPRIACLVRVIRAQSYAWTRTRDGACIAIMLTGKRRGILLRSEVGWIEEKRGIRIRRGMVALVCFA